jgi:GNAT superfamily N-acetyltransferase
MTYNITFEKNPSSADIQIIADGYMENAYKLKGHRPIEFFAFFLRDNDDNSKILGGCNGNSLYGCLYIDGLWVTESLRGQGLGIKLMEAAEHYAKELGCTFLTVNTMDWEALDFYKKIGYFVEFERHGFEKNSIMYFLRKDL